ncbi:hypothetical protein [Aliikangiella sp. G2MR2-5]|uniref:hypothetical protein n=1 Tax=Aliikangiella sp. G2MR2-5 TaxID=2788943 RepID=UPI0018ABB98E|nr:hypothetical protein [Aliikangiella sp. G2MR2-5]
MKITLATLTIVLAGLLASQSANAVGPVSSPGWYYTTVSYSNGSPSFGRAGPFSDEATCQAVRWNDYGDGGAIPWDGGPGCFYLYENQIGAYNEILQHWNLATGPNTGQPHLEMEMSRLLDSVNILIEQHAISGYRKSLNTLSNIEEKEVIKR